MFDGKLQSILDALDAFVYEVDLDGKLISISDRVFESFGYRPDEVVGHTFFEYMTDDEAKHAKKVFSQHIAKQEPMRLVDFVFLTKSGEERVLAVSARPLFDDDGVLAGYLGIGNDITERRQLEDRLRHSEKMDSLGRLAGGIAHDFNNQLASIIGFAEMIAENAPAPYADYASRIVAAGTNSAVLIKQLLAFARKGTLKCVSFDLHHSIRNVIAMISRIFDKRIKFVLDLCVEAVAVNGDPAYIENALLNILLNSRDAMPEGGSVVVRTSVKEGFVGLEIEDNGCGMSQDVLEHMFEPFFTTKGESGNGLGMPAVYGAIKMHNGHIDIESQVGRGTKVKIEIPVLESNSCLPNVLRDMVIRASHSYKLLVVDDDEYIRSMLSDILPALGYSARFEKGALEAIRTYKAYWQDIDAVVLDVMLPDGSGVQVYNELRAINPDVKVIVMSGYSCSHLDERLIAEASAVVGKPFTISEISQVLNRCLDK